MHLETALKAHFLAIQAGALFVCVGWMVVQAGLGAAIGGVGVWIVGQVVILPIAIATMPIGLGFRCIGGKLFGKTRVATLVTGVVAGVSGWLTVAWELSSTTEGLAKGLVFAAVAGLIGGAVWMTVERSSRKVPQ